MLSDRQFFIVILVAGVAAVVGVVLGMLWPV